jgi:DNA-directed RNA polymerase subunit RPC12/RpoP
MTSATTAYDQPRERPRIVFVERPRCPACGSIRLQTYRTTQNGDSTVTRHARCRDCSQRILVVVE